MQSNFAWRACASLLLVLACAAGATAQNSVQPAKSGSDGAPSSPLSDSGFSFDNTFTETHDDASGWTTQLQPSLRYDFSEKFAVEAGLPIYFGQPPAITGTTTRNPRLPAASQNVSYSSIGDFYMDGQMSLNSDPLDYQGTLTVTAPTGSTTQGISTGRATFDFNNHLDHEIWQLSPFIEAGVGNSVATANLHHYNAQGVASRAFLPYNTLGMESHFQAGTSLDLSKAGSIDLDAYDILPFGNQTVFSRTIPRTVTRTVTTARGTRTRTFTVSALLQGAASIAADHGFGASWDFNPTPRMDVEVGYQRSINYALNTVTMTIGYRIGHLPPKHGSSAQ